MKSQDRENEYSRKILGGFGEEWTTANRKERVELNRRISRWQELVDNGWTATKAYFKVMEELQETPPIHPFWTKMRKAFVVIPVLALAAAIVYGIVIIGEIDTLKTELESVQSVLASTQSELGSMKQTLTSTQAQLNSTEQTLTSTQAELNSTEQILTSTQSELGSTEQALASTQAELTSTQLDLDSTEVELSSTKQTLASTQSELTTTKQTLASTQQQLAVAQETLGGLGITLSTSKECSDVDLIDNSTATNPTWSQLMAFLSQDQTEKHAYIENVYDCSQFSKDVHNNAEAEGIRAAEVHVEFRNEVKSHALNAFLTTDYGLVYICCTEAPDTIARVKTGKEYRAVKLYRITKTNVRNDYWWDSLSSYYYIPSSTRGHSVTESIEIYW